MNTPAKVRVHYGRTVNMGNYESLRLEMMTEVVAPDDEELDRSVLELRKAMKAAIDEEVAYWRGLK